jgi:hypothetical protein
MINPKPENDKLDGFFEFAFLDALRAEPCFFGCSVFDDLYGL